jgi:hypothetical protein
MDYSWPRSVGKHCNINARDSITPGRDSRYDCTVCGFAWTAPRVSVSRFEDVTCCRCAAVPEETRAWVKDVIERAIEDHRSDFSHSRSQDWT